SVLFGRNELGGDLGHGYRLRGGLFVTPDRSFGLEAEWFQLLGLDDSFNAAGDGSSIIARPFFDVTTGQESSQLISFPGLVAGNVGVASDTDFDSLLINGRVALCPISCDRCSGEESDRFDWLIGFRHVGLDDNLTIAEDVRGIATNAPQGRITATDSFNSRNDFIGLQLGFAHRAFFRRIWLETTTRVAIGNNHREVSINGSTTSVLNGVTTNHSSGIFAQRSNIGVYQDDAFVMIPELGITLGVRITDSLHATLGYNVVYFPNVLRAQDQIDTDLNPNLFPPEANPFSGALRPRYLARESDFYAHGLTLGAQLVF
ncbi:MAG: BBP7 family outer membrane beta-barrel protein, partial [Planctomycetota bacterium]